MHKALDDFEKNDGAQVKLLDGSYHEGLYKGLVKEPSGRYSLVLRCRVQPSNRLTNLHIRTTHIDVLARVKK
jgi:hypothetical protein